MDRELLRVAARLLDERRPYVIATVVRRERPSSASPGNTAVITADGAVHGWIGGSCTQPEVVRHALAALDDGSARLLAFGGSPGARGDLISVPMSCGSEGKVEVHINPVFPVPQLVVAGSSPIAAAVARLGKAMGYRVAIAADDLGGNAPEYAERPRGTKLVAVVATMGQGDEQAVLHLLAAKPDYLGVVVSPKRMEQVRAWLAQTGAGAEEIARVKGPAGLDIGAESPEEVAISILAEIVAMSAEERASPAAEVPEPSQAETATDPVCGMTVPTDGSRPSSTYQGKTVHFCCEGCRGRFDANPAAYV